MSLADQLKIDRDAVGQKMKDLIGDPLAQGMRLTNDGLTRIAIALESGSGLYTGVMGILEWLRGGVIGNVFHKMFQGMKSDAEKQVDRMLTTPVMVAPATTRTPGDILAAQAQKRADIETDREKRREARENESLEINRRNLRIAEQIADNTKELTEEERVAVEQTGATTGRATYPGNTRTTSSYGFMGRTP
jgi:hypothetical protein